MGRPPRPVIPPAFQRRDHVQLPRRRLPAILANSPSPLVAHAAWRCGRPGAARGYWLHSCPLGKWHERARELQRVRVQQGQHGATHRGDPRRTRLHRADYLLQAPPTPCTARLEAAVAAHTGALFTSAAKITIYSNAWFEPPSGPGVRLDAVTPGELYVTESPDAAVSHRREFRDPLWTVPERCA